MPVSHALLRRNQKLQPLSSRVITTARDPTFVKPRWKHPNGEYQRLAKNAARRKSGVMAATRAVDARCGQLIASTGTRHATAQEEAHRRPGSRTVTRNLAVPRKRLIMALTLGACRTTVWRRPTEHRRPCYCSCTTARLPTSPS